MNDHNLSRLPKLQSHVLEARSLGYDISVERLGPGHGVGSASTDGKLTLNNWFLRGLAPEFSEDRLIVVLYHEIGHIDYFKSSGLVAGDSIPSQTQSEFGAFEKSLEECKKILDQGDEGPLRTALHYIGMRQSSGLEAPDYQMALNQIVQSTRWADLLKIF